VTIGRFAFIAFVLAAASLPAVAVEVVPDAAVVAAEQERIATIRRISLPTLAILDEANGGGGSGVVISADGYALTNFHVSAPCGTAHKCGMTDGRVYDAVIVGIDPTGDVALIKLFGRDDFPAAELGDSDAVRAGAWAFVVGNPFLLADDFQPTVTYGIISGVHRYQYPSGTLLEYADCLQTDASINPGNSGGPLFNADGQLIGINGRGSFEKRGRVNVGVGYAISINQIKRFLGVLKSGRIVDHASLGATASLDESGRVVIDEILESSDAFRRGMRYGDQIERLGGREIDTVNALKNVIGIYPRGWRVPVTFRRGAERFERLVRLEGNHADGELVRLVEQGEMPEPELPERPDGETPEVPQLSGHTRSKIPTIVAEHFEERSGYANYWFNRDHQQRIISTYRSQTDLASAGLDWHVHGRVETGGDVEIHLAKRTGSITMPIGQSRADFDQPLSETLSPPNSGGLLAALHAWQRLVAVGPRKFGDIYYHGTMPWPRNKNDFHAGVDHEPLADCLVGNYGGAETRFYFDRETGDLVGIEFFAAEDFDPCEIYFGDIRGIDGARLPHRWEVRHGDEVYGVFEITAYRFGNGAED
jgi:S1-C subfamily serine protease